MATEANIVEDYFTAEDKVLVFTVYQSNGTTVQNISGFAGISWMLKQHFTDTDVNAKIEKTLSSGIVITDGPNGICEVTLTPSDIAALAANQLYVHELKRTDSPKTVLSYGRFVLQQAVHAA